MFQSGNRILTFFFTLAMVLSGAMAGLFVSSWHDKISPKAVGWYPYGITTPGDGDRYMYYIDETAMKPDTYNGVTAYGGNLAVNVDMSSHMKNGGACLLFNGNFVTPETKSEYRTNSSYGGPQYGANELIGYYTTGANNLVPTYRLPPGYLGEWADYQFVNAVKDCYGHSYTLKMHLDNFSFGVQNSKKSVDCPILAGFKDDRFWFFAQDWAADNSNVGVSFNVNMIVDGAPPGKVLNVWQDLDQPSIIGSMTATQTHPTSRIYGPSPVCQLWYYQEGIGLGGAGTTGNVYTNSPTSIGIYNCSMGHVFDVCGTRNTDGVDRDLSCASFLGMSSGYSFQWAGSVCATAVGINLQDNMFPKVTATVNVSYQQADGTWGVGQSVYSKSDILKGSSFNYTWPCDHLNTDAVYRPPEWSGGDVQCNVVNDHSIDADTTYTIYVPRRWYNYYFDFDACIPPEHDSSEIGNKQQTITKLAENWSGDVINPTMTGFTFLGFSDSKVSGFTNSFYGNAYSSSQMLSDKVFYAQWRRNKYKVIYNANGGTNFNHLDGEYTQNETGGHMNESTFEYGVEGKLRKNTYTREGYTFMGWRKKRSGTGTLYRDEYDKVLNWSSEDGDSIVLYAQWRKNFGAETLTVVSEETGNPVQGVTMKLQKKKNGTWTDMGTTATTGTDGKISARNLHWFNYRWVMTAVPTGYMKNTETPSSCYSSYPSTDFKICPCRSCGKAVCDKFSVKHNVILYMKHANITITSVVDCILDGEDPPAFIYRIRGNDVAGVQHEYYITTPVNRSTKTGVKTLVHDIFAGEYTISRLNVSRYVPKKPYNLTNMTRSGMNAVANVKENSSASASFPYTLTNHGWYYGVDNRSNALRK